jgi:hypothetical protein
MPETVIVQCRFDLTDVEIATLARKRAVLEGKMAELDAAFAVAKEKHKNVAGLFEKDANELGFLIQRGYELRDAECTVEFDYEGGMVHTVRVDTGEVVKTREMTESEKGKGRPLPLGPAILLDASDPDGQAAEQAPPEPEEPPDAEKEALPDCQHCGHPEGVHGQNKERACMRQHCDCDGYVHPDPLGIADAEPETQEAEL